ncbi:hypothetical protein A2814_00165 [Candidatus Nomurabacteria bacterium RIFCSPHIGHO2_01_FULL_38_19]|uniref:Uncharacterized protein n=1 Tax=Candidatus Nomurabacteria bacterium RIFCSPHIGHO2_01_FULL_38_19 TaxID=1801732 RepID=A0A1F6UQU6_9BACT|nr:MAG: hypothetical protein A2814_00165 [Candidatus Nomurabacteria bacterium RIFCSPHIGHO2_01_FULL_38_19]
MNNIEIKMIIENKRKLKLNAKSKILVLGLIFVTLVGFFGLTTQANAQSPEDLSGTPAAQTATATATGTGVGNNLPSCNLLTVEVSVGGCLVQIFYYSVFALPAAILTLTAWFFNGILALTLSSVMYSKGSDFLLEAWKIVRDFSNIFFILILLYVAIKMTLGLGGAEIKKMIVNVVIVALLINFSMFFTKIVIDSSNILALIFYNKIAVNVKNSDQSYKEIQGFKPEGKLFDESITRVTQKDFANGILNSFDPSKSIDQATYDANKGDTNLLYTIVNMSYKWSASGWLEWFTGTGRKGQDIIGAEPSIGFYLVVITVTGAIFLFAAWTFFIAGLAFLGRLVELWLCIIFSPFAFLSFVVPQLKSVEWLGWDAWLKRLTTVAFMAPIFMFFMLVIAKLTQAHIFSSFGNKNLKDIQLLVLIAIPVIINITLLMKATAFAKKGAGEFGTMAIKVGGVAAGVVGGLALGAATGGAGLAARATLGRAGAAMANSEFAKTSGAFGRGIGNVGKWVGGRSFDARGVSVGGKTLASATGIKVGEAQKGGFIEARKIKDEKRRKRAEELKVGPNEQLRKNANALEEAREELLLENSDKLERLNKAIEVARTQANDLNSKDTIDPTKVAEKNAAIAKAKTITGNPAALAAALASANAIDVNDYGRKGNEIAKANAIIDPVAKATALALANAMDDATEGGKVGAKKVANDKLEELKEHKKAIREGKSSFTVTSLTDKNLKDGRDGAKLNTATGLVEKITPITNNTVKINGIDYSIEKLETQAIPDALNEIKKEDRTRLRAFAQELRKPGKIARTVRFLGAPITGDSQAARDTTAHAIIMDTKLPDSVAKTS